MSRSDVLHGGSACGIMHSVSSRICLLVLMMHVKDFVLALALCLLLGACGGRGGIVSGIGFTLCSGPIQHEMGWSSARHDICSTSMSSL